MTQSDLVLLRALHDEHAHALWSFCLHLTGADHARAEDLVQETLLRAWRHPEVMGGPPAALRPWLFTVARHLFIDQWRSRRSRPEVVTDHVPEREDTADATDELLLSWVVADAVRTLSPDHRAVLLECYYRGRPVAEVAARLGIPPGTVKSRTHYALRALRLSLEEMGVVS